VEPTFLEFADMETSPATPLVGPFEDTVCEADFVHSCRSGDCTEPDRKKLRDQNAAPEEVACTALEGGVVADDEFGDDRFDIASPQDSDLEKQPAENDFDGFDDAEQLPEYGDFWIDTDDIDHV
jgi:hypothetical protein